MWILVMISGWHHHETLPLVRDQLLPLPLSGCLASSYPGRLPANQTGSTDQEGGWTTASKLLDRGWDTYLLRRRAQADRAPRYSGTVTTSGWRWRTCSVLRISGLSVRLWSRLSPWPAHLHRQPGCWCRNPVPPLVELAGGMTGHLLA